MAVAYHSTKSLTAATGTGVASSAWDLTGLSNPVILVHIAMNRNGGALPSVSSLTWSLGGGSASKVIGVSTAFTTIETWVIPAPTAGSGTFTPTLSTSVAYQITADAFTGADQTTPCPTGDAVSTTGAGPAHTLTPTNVVAGDGQAGMGAQTVNDNPVSYAPNQTYLSGSTSINAMAGYRIGTGNVVTTWDGTNTAEKASTGVRIAQAAGGTSIAVPAGTVTMAGLALTLLTAFNLAMPAGVLAFTGQAPTVAINNTATSISVPAGSLTFTSTAPAPAIDHPVAMPAGSVALTGQFVAIAFGGELTAGSLTFTGYAPSITIGGSLTFAMPAGVLAFTGLAPTVDAGGAISVPAGVLTFTSSAPAIAWGVGLPAGSLGFTGQTPVSSVRMNIDVPAGSLVLTSQALTMDAPKALAIPAGVVTLTGYALQANNSGVGTRSPQNRGRGRAR